MGSVLEAIEDWIRGLLVSGIMGNLTSIFVSVNNQVGQIATEVGRTPASFSPAVYGMIRTLSENVIMPIAGLILTFIACYELIQLVISHNNLANFETWIFKTFVAVTLITNTMNITMAVFDVAQHVVSQAGGIIGGSTAVDASALATMQATLESMDIGPLLGVFLQCFVIQIMMSIVSVLIFVIVYARMIEIYLVTSVAPVPMAAMMGKEWGGMGQNYLRSLLALAFQGFLIIVCIAIYAVLVQNMLIDDNISTAIWLCMGYTVLLCFTLFKTGSLAKSIFNSH